VKTRGITVSRSWERKIQKNQQVINKRRKKQGQAPLLSGKAAADPVDTFKGRSILMPAFLLLFILMYVIMTVGTQTKQSSTMFWVTIGCYILLAVTFILRRPYLSVGKDFVKTRRFGGDKSVYKDNIKSISVQKGYVIISQHKGGNWVFSRLINRYPTEEMAQRLRTFASANQIAFEEK
jgi:hypothetical protein